MAEPSGELRAFRIHALALSFVLLLSSLIILPSASYFFQGDSLYWLEHRYQSWSEVAQAFVSLDSHGWYRPLSHRFIPSLFFPIFGMDPGPYHLPVFGLFLLVSLLGYRVFLRLTGSALCALLSTAFFALHSNQVFVTFDFFSEPDLLYAIFGLLTFLSFLKWQESRRLGSLLLSALWFVLALFSKEPAIILPPILVLLHLLEPKRSRLWNSGLSLHATILGGYVVFVFVWLRGGTLESGLWSLSTSIATMGDHLARLVMWSFNLPWGWHSHFRELPIIAWLGLAFLALLIFLLWIRIGYRQGKQVKPLWVGLGWFFIASAPLLFLLDLKPYYLVFPLLGFSLAVGIALTELAETLPSAGLRTALLLFIFGCLTVTNAILSDQDRRQHPLLGGSARLNEQVREDVLRALPRVDRDTHLLILGRTEGLAHWSFAHGGLFRLVYGEPELGVFFASQGFFLSPQIPLQSLHVFQFEGGHFRDVTEDFRADPTQFLLDEADVDYGPVEPELIRVEPGRVLAGRDSYRLEVQGLADLTVEIQFRMVDGGPLGVVPVSLDAEGGITYYVSDQTPRGRYTFFALREPGGTRWRRSTDAVLLVE